VTRRDANTARGFVVAAGEDAPDILFFEHMRPTYGVITATLNAAEQVGRAVDSVLAQSELPAEYVIVDGGSTDGTLAEVEIRVERARQLGLPIEFRILRQTSAGGIAGAWNEGIATLSSDVVFLLNADDALELQAARVVLSAFEADPQREIVHAKARFYRADGSHLGICAPTWINRVGLQCRTVHCATFVRREVYERVGGFDAAFHTTLDFDFLERCRASRVQFAFVDEIVTNFQLGGVSNSLRDQADWETLIIGLRHSKTMLPPLCAYLFRRVLMRPFGLAGFNLRLKREKQKQAIQPRQLRPLPEIASAAAGTLSTRALATSTLATNTLAVPLASAAAVPGGGIRRVGEPTELRGKTRRSSGNGPAVRSRQA